MEGPFAGGGRLALTLTSPAFAHGGEIPALYTCEGDDINPPLTWDWVPEGTRSFALIVDDPDAPDPKKPQRTWVHWVLYNMDDNTREIPADVDEDQLPPGTQQGLNDWKRTGWGGPCPPIGRHRYFFRLYALRHELPDLEEPTKDELLSEMEGMILETAELMGTYEKRKRKS